MLIFPTNPEGIPPKDIEYIKKDPDPSIGISFPPNFFTQFDAAQLLVVVKNLHACKVYNFTCKNVFKDEGNDEAKLTSMEFWNILSTNGYNDYETNFDTWSKPINCELRLNFNYLENYANDDPDTLDESEVYSAILGSSDEELDDYLSLDDFKASGINTFIELMAGTAEASYYGHFNNPNIEFIMTDLDPKYKEVHDARNWTEGSKHKYLIGDMLVPSTWDELLVEDKEKAVSFIGKQSLSYFKGNEVAQIIHNALEVSKYLIVEIDDTAAGYNPYRNNEDDYDHTTVAMGKLGLSVHLRADRDTFNDVTSQITLNTVIESTVSNKKRTTLPYTNWRIYNLVTLSAIVSILGYKLSFVSPHEDENHLVPVEDFYKYKHLFNLDQDSDDDDDLIDLSTFYTYIIHKA